MPWILIFFAALYFMAAWQGSASLTALNTNLSTDIPNYGKFMLMVVAIWALGLWEPARKPAMLLLALILVSIALTSGQGFFTGLSQLGATTGTAPTNTAPSQATVQSGVGADLGGGNNTSGVIGDVTGTLGNIVGGGAGGGFLSGLSGLFGGIF